MLAWEELNGGHTGWGLFLESKFHLDGVGFKWIRVNSLNTTLSTTKKFYCESRRKTSDESLLSDDWHGRIIVTTIFLAFVLSVDEGLMQCKRRLRLVPSSEQWNVDDNDDTVGKVEKVTCGRTHARTRRMARECDVTWRSSDHYMDMCFSTFDAEEKEMPERIKTTADDV